MSLEEKSQQLGWISRFLRFHAHYRNGHFQENRENHIKGEFEKNPGIHPRYHFCGFPQNDNLGLTVKILKFLGIQPTLRPSQTIEQVRLVLKLMSWKGYLILPNPYLLVKINAKMPKKWPSQRLILFQTQSWGPEQGFIIFKSPVMFFIVSLLLLSFSVVVHKLKTN